MRKGFIIVVLAITSATVGFASRNTSAGQSVAGRFEKYKGEVKEKAKEKTREFLDREKKAKEAAKEVAHEIVNKAIDHYIPGGDNHPAKAVGDAAFNKDPWYKAFFRVFLTPSEIGPEPTFTDPQQTVTDTPVVPANPSNDTAGTTTHVQSTPVVPVGPSNENASSPTASGTATPGGREGGGSQRDFKASNSDPASFAPSKGGNGNDASASNNASGNQANPGTAQSQSKPIMLEAGKTTWAQADPNKEIAVNPPETTGSSASNNSSVSANAPSQSAQPAATPTTCSTPWFGGVTAPFAPAPQASNSSPTPAPAPTPAPSGSNGGGSGGGGGPLGLGGLIERALGPAMPHDVGVTPAQHDHDSSGHGGGGGGHEPPGNHAGPDAHGAEVDHAGHIA